METFKDVYGVMGSPAKFKYQLTVNAQINPSANRVQINKKNCVNRSYAFD